MCMPYFVKVNKNSFQLKTLLFFVHLRSQRKRTEKVISNYHIYSCHFDIVILRVAIINNAQNVRLQRRHRPTNDQRRPTSDLWRFHSSMAWFTTSTNRCSFNGSRWSQPFRKSSTPRLLHFLFETSLINRVTPYFFISRHFLSISCSLLLTCKFLT